MKSFKLVVFFCLLSVHFVVPLQQSLSFDTLFPIFWYEKALRSTMRATHIIRSLGSENDDSIQEAQLIMALGHMSFVNFCIGSIDDTRVNADDFHYCSRLLDQFIVFLTPIQSSMHGVQSISDQIDCLLNMVRVIQKQLYVKANI